MRVEPLITSDGKTRYMLVNDIGEPVEAVLQFLKFKDNTGAARNTLRTYCYHLKLFFEFLEQSNQDYRLVGLDEMSSFMRWLKNPYGNQKVVSLHNQSSSRMPRTINMILSTVIYFYDYLMRLDSSNDLSQKLKMPIMGNSRGFKDFLYHINKDKLYSAKILKVPVPKEKPKTLSKEEISQIYDACNNLRDKFLIQLLWESSIRIGEALSLWLEDFEVDARRICIQDRGELTNYAEIKTVNSPRKVDVSSELINMYLEYISVFHTDEVDTNHVFIKLNGVNRYQPLQYGDVISLMKRLRKNTGIYITPHMLRHSSLTELRKAGWKDEHLMKRAGHAHIQTTLQMYVHPSDEDIRQDWEKSNEQMRLKMGQRR